MGLIKSPSFIRILPFAVYILFLSTQDLFSLNVNWLYTLKASLVLAVLMFYWKQYSELNSIKEVRLEAWLVSIISGVLVFLIWIIPFPSWAELGHSHVGFIPLKSDGSLDIALVIVRISGAALVVPVMEELFWRSYIMRWLESSDFLSVNPEKVSAYAFIGTASLFAIEHQLWFAGLLAGLTYGYLYMKYRNLWVPILAHAITNGMLGVWVVITHQWQYW
jgi:hypothetical protein